MGLIVSAFYKAIWLLYCQVLDRHLVGVYHLLRDAGAFRMSSRMLIGSLQHIDWEEGKEPAQRAPHHKPRATSMQYRLDAAPAPLVGAATPSTSSARPPPHLSISHTT